MAQGSEASALDLPSWKTILSTVCAFLLAGAFLVSGFWKLVDPLGTEARMVQALIWPQLALVAALGVGIAEAWAGVLLLIPGWRRWGALLAAALLVVFMLYMAWNYNALRGEDCSCFPWLKRVVGPAFFVGDAIMLLMAAAAGVWCRRSGGVRNAVIAVAALAVFCGAMYGVGRARLTGLEAPPSVQTTKGTLSLKHGKILLYFYDPMCSHCFRVAKQMSSWKWADGVRVVAVAITVPQFAQGFLEDTGLAPIARSSTDKDALLGVFKFGDPPYAVALEYGRQKEAFAVFEGDSYQTGLRNLGFIQ